MSHSTLRAKRATFTFWVDKSSLKMPKMIHFGEFLKTWSLLSNSVIRQVTFNKTKIGGKGQNWQNSNATFIVIFKLCALWICEKVRKKLIFALKEHKSTFWSANYTFRYIWFRNCIEELDLSRVCACHEMRFLANFTIWT